MTISDDENWCKVIVIHSVCDISYNCFAQSPKFMVLQVVEGIWIYCIFKFQELKVIMHIFLKRPTLDFGMKP
jgi:hypothetical protein